MRGKLKLLYKSYIGMALAQFQSQGQTTQIYKLQEFLHEFYEMKQMIAWPAACVRLPLDLAFPSL